MFAGLKESLWNFIKLVYGFATVILVILIVAAIIGLFGHLGLEDTIFSDVWQAICLAGQATYYFFYILIFDLFIRVFTHAL